MKDSHSSTHDIKQSHIILALINLIQTDSTGLVSLDFKLPKSNPSKMSHAKTNVNILHQVSLGSDVNSYKNVRIYQIAYDCIDGKLMISVYYIRPKWTGSFSKASFSEYAFVPFRFRPYQMKTIAAITNIAKVIHAK